LSHYIQWSKFKKNGKRALKKTFWYAMEANPQKLIPQTEEDITEARWVNLSKVNSLKGPMFKNIKDVIKIYHQNILETH